MNTIVFLGYMKKNWLDNTIKYLLVEGWMEFLITVKYPGYCSWLVSYCNGFFLY